MGWKVKSSLVKGYVFRELSKEFKQQTPSCLPLENYKYSKNSLNIIAKNIGNDFIVISVYYTVTNPAIFYS